MEWHDSPETSDEDLETSFEFFYRTSRRMGIHANILNFLGSSIRNLGSPRSVSVLDLCCGRGDLASSILNWGKARNIDIQVLAVDRFGRLIQMAKERHGHKKGITFDIRDFSDSSFHHAQQFDFVVSSMGLHHLSDTQIVPFIRTVNLLAKAGFIICDLVRSARALMVMSVLSKMWGEEIIRHDAPLSIKRSLTVSDLERYVKEAGVDATRVQNYFGIYFRLTAERRLAMDPKLSPVPGLLST